jgi:hypothetical protein
VSASEIPHDAVGEEQQGTGDGQARGPRLEHATSVHDAVTSGQREPGYPALHEHLSEKLNALGVRP